MTDGLQDLLSKMRQHPAFKEFLASVEASPVRHFKPSQPVAEQNAEWIFRSGRQHQDNIWRDFLTERVPQTGESKRKTDD